MNKFCFIIFSLPILAGCDQSNSSAGNHVPQIHLQSKTIADPNTNQHDTVRLFHQRNLFTLRDAEKILGQPAHLKDSASTREGDISKYSCSFTANSKEKNTGKTSTIFFLFEQYEHVSSAQKVYASIKTANENHDGFNTLHDLGDEAYFHSDGKNFCFILVRNGGKMFRMKVNKITGTTSLDEFNKVAKNITAVF